MDARDSVRNNLDDQSNSEIDRVLLAWNSATDRLQKTHEVLRDEVRRLTSELEVKNRELARKNRLADLGQVATHVAHEVRNGLAPVTLYLSLLRRMIDQDAGAVSILDKVESGCAALQTTVTDLLNFTADRDPVWRSVPVGELIEEVRQALEPQLVAQEIDVDVDVPSRLCVLADPDMLRRAVLNLVLNSLDAMPDGGQLVVTGILTPGGFELEVADSGPGIAEELQDRVFEPFFTTKSDGTGLGLAIVYRIAEVHSGEVLAGNCPEGGAAITIRIPSRVAELEAAA